MTAQTVSAVISGVSVIVLAAIGRGLLGMRRDVRQFMAEHMWLLATTLWTRDNVRQIMQALGMPETTPPPDNLRARHRDRP